MADDLASVERERIKQLCDDVCLFLNAVRERGGLVAEAEAEEIDEQRATSRERWGRDDMYERRAGEPDAVQVDAGRRGPREVVVAEEGAMFRHVEGAH